MNQEFLKPRLIGQRFEQHSVPLEVLKDFTALETMLIEVAKRDFFQTNQNRLRLPKGFTNGLELHLTAVTAGSATLVIDLMFSTLLPSANMDYFIRAKEQVLDAIDSIKYGQKLALPSELLRYFDRFGRSLRDDEKIEFTRDNGQIVTFNRAIREKLLFASQADEWTEEVMLKGLIPEIDQSTMRFELQQRTGIKIKAPLNAQHWDTVLEAVSRYKNKQLVVVQGVIKRNRANQIQSFESVGHIRLLDPLDIETRLEKLSELADGWLDGKGRCLDKGALQILIRYFDDYFAPNLPLPYLYPTADGGIQAEWSHDNWEITLEIRLPDLTAEYQALHLISNSCIEETFTLTQGESIWNKLNALLLQIFGETA